MSDTARAVLLIVFVIIVFWLSYLSFDHIDDSYMANEPEHVTALEAENDSLKKVVRDLGKKLDDCDDSSDSSTEDTDE
jgi:hypothetical protein